MDLPKVNNIPDKLVNARVYSGIDKTLYGAADVELPTLEYLNETISGLGLLGEMETPTIGHFKAFTFKFKWNVICKDAITLMEPKSHHLEIHAGLQEYDASNGEWDQPGVKVVMNAIPKKLSLGKIAMGKTMDGDAEFSCPYIKLSREGETLFEIDVPNIVCMINGKDYATKLRKNMGME